MDLYDILYQIRCILEENNLKVACAESCTGGLVSSYLTDIEGASQYIEQNFVTYSNEAKTRFLNVKKETLDTMGAVSYDVGYQMALGLLDYAGCSLSTTGILGPSGGSEEKPIGLCYIGMGYQKGKDKKIEVIKFQSELAKTDVKNKRVEIKKDIAKNTLNYFLGFLRENVAQCKET